MRQCHKTGYLGPRRSRPLRGPLGIRDPERHLDGDAHVTGAVAVLRSIAPALTVDELESALTSGALDIEDPGADNLSGAGRLDLYVSAQVALHGPGFPVVKAVATADTASEAGPTSGTNHLHPLGGHRHGLEIKYTVGGTATSGSDYEPVPAGVTIPPERNRRTSPSRPLTTRWRKPMKRSFSRSNRTPPTSFQRIPRRR